MGGDVSFKGNLPDAQEFSYSLTGVDSRCNSGAGEAANSCGMHIHAGTDCTSDAGGHYFDEKLAEDPWAKVSYTAVGSVSCGCHRAAGLATAHTGLASKATVSHAFIVHDFDGARIACALVRG